ncbi:MAG TPA: hypothetical protein EYG18_02340 [Micavibrio sp.]|nr:hypothetical protein [Micavibrio sp.]HIL28087.1 hypothetical protein [Micavibrio sp.]
MLGWIKERRAKKLEQQADRIKQDFTELKEELALKNHAALILGKAMFGDPAGPVESPGALIDEGDENFERIELGRKFLNAATSSMFKAVAPAAYGTAFVSDGGTNPDRVSRERVLTSVFDSVKDGAKRSTYDVIDMHLHFMDDKKAAEFVKAMFDARQRNPQFQMK